MPSKLPVIQVRFSDPALARMLEVLARSPDARSKSKLLERLSARPILEGFKAWLRSRLDEGATYSELFGETAIPVPDLMALSGPVEAPTSADVERHLRAISERTGFDLLELWRRAPRVELGGV